MGPPIPKDRKFAQLIIHLLWLLLVYPESVLRNNPQQKALAFV
jgi:hypothetical protein